MSLSTRSTDSLSVISTEDGLHISESILWLDACKVRQVSFLSSARVTASDPGPQVITTRQTLKLLEAKRKKPKALVCDYFHPFALGRLNLELLPSGGFLGGALLLVELNGKKLLYAPSLFGHKCPLANDLSLRKAHSLLIGAFHPEPGIKRRPREYEMERLLETILKCKKLGKAPVLMCPPIGLAQEMTRFLSSSGLWVGVNNEIYRYNEVYNELGVELGNYGIWHHSRTFDAYIFPLENNPRRHLRTPIPEGPLFYVEESVQETLAPDARKQVSDRFFISSHSDGTELQDMIHLIAPNEIHFFGAYAKQYVDFFKKSAARVTALYPNSQPTLF